MNIDFTFCDRVNCKHLSKPMKAFGIMMQAYCYHIVEHNGQHIYTNNDGDTIEDKDNMIPWDNVPEGCPFKLEAFMDKQ